MAAVAYCIWEEIGRLHDHLSGLSLPNLLPIRNLGSRGASRLESADAEGLYYRGLLLWFFCWRWSADGMGVWLHWGLCIFTVMWMITYFSWNGYLKGVIATSTRSWGLWQCCPRFDVYPQRGLQILDLELQRQDHYVCWLQSFRSQKTLLLFDSKIVKRGKAAVTRSAMRWAWDVLSHSMKKVGCDCSVLSEAT